MKVILTQDIAKLGRRSSVVEVPDGRGLNQLIPQGLAMAATPENVKKLQATTDVQAAKDGAEAMAFSDAITKLGDNAVTVTVTANENGHLFEAVKEGMVVDALAESGIVVTPHQIQISDPIKTVGAHEIVLHHGDDRHAVTLEVTAKE